MEVAEVAEVVVVLKNIQHVHKEGGSFSRSLAEVVTSSTIGLEGPRKEHNVPEVLIPADEFYWRHSRKLMGDLPGT